MMSSGRRNPIIGSLRIKVIRKRLLREWTRSMYALAASINADSVTPLDA